MYSSSPISWPSFKLLAQILFEIPCWQVQNVEIFKVPLNSGKNWRIRSEVNQVIYSSSSISSQSFKPLKYFSRYLADKISFWFFRRGITPEREITRTRKKYGSAIFPWGIHIWNFKTIACTVHKIWYASKSVTNGHMDNPKPICPLNFFEVRGIKNTTTEWNYNSSGATIDQIYR